jgi:hypothetical protein
MSTRRLVTLIVFLAVFAMAARVSVDTDTWWHLRAGQWIVEHHAVPQVDPFSYTRQGDVWQYPGWVVEVPMYWIYRALGPGGLNIWTAFMVTLAFVFVWKTLSGGVFLRAFVVVLAAAASGVYWAARPYLVTFVLAAVFLWILEDFRWEKGRGAHIRIWLLPVLMVLWANSHGGFAVGFLIWGVYCTAEFVNWVFPRMFNFIKKGGDQQLTASTGQRLVLLLLVGLFMVIAVSLNPSGPVMLLYPFKTVGITALKNYIQEWQSPDFHSISVQPFVWLLIITFVVVGASRRRIALTDFLLFAGFAYMALMAGRNIAIFALVAPMVLTRHADTLLAAIGRSLGLRAYSAGPVRRVQTILNSILLGVLIIAVLLKVSLVFPESANNKVFQDTLPVEAVNFIKSNHLQGRLFSSYNWGGYLLWTLPEYRVFIDGRTDLYNDEVINQWLQVVRAEDGWQNVLEKWNVHLILLEPTMKVVELLPGNGWRMVYSDREAVIYTK